MTQFIFTSLISHLYDVLLCDLERQALLRETCDHAKVRRNLSSACPLGGHNQPTILLESSYLQGTFLPHPTRRGQIPDIVAIHLRRLGLVTLKLLDI